MKPNADPQGDQAALFDGYATAYGEAVNSTIGPSGESVEYFAMLKARLLRKGVVGGTALRVLDFGCGTGLSTRALASQLASDTHLTGTDPSLESLRVARARGPGNATFVDLPSEGLPFDDDTFDVIFTACVFHHIDRSAQARWMGELTRTLKPGGQLWVFEHNPYNPLTRRAVRLCEFDEGVTLLTPTYTQRLLQASGLLVGSPYHYFFLPRMLSALRRFEPLFRRIPLGAQYYVVGRKPAGDR